MSSKLIIFSAPSGSGKSTIKNYLLKQDLNLKFSISATSRKPRGTEKDGVEYYFLSPEAFKERIANGEFLEYEEVYEDCFYGTLKSEVERILKEGCNVLLDVDVVGGCNIKKQYGNNALSIFIQPPSIEELRKRLEMRNTDSPETIEQRMKKAEFELGFAQQFDKIIVNDNLEMAQKESLQTIKNYIKRMIKTGIFPGSFNPVHIGHLALANYIAEFENYDEIWFLITPQNPAKGEEELIPQEMRLELVEKSIAGYEKFKTCTIEWELPRPVYTVNTLQKLRRTYPDRIFELVIGADNWRTFHRWKDYQIILKNFQVVVYPRKGMDKVNYNHYNVRYCEAPMIEISSTFIRKSLKEGKDIRFFLPDGVYEKILSENILDNFINKNDEGEMKIEVEDML